MDAANLFAALDIAEGGFTIGRPSSWRADRASNRKATSAAPLLPMSRTTRPSSSRRSVPFPRRRRSGPILAASEEKFRKSASAPSFENPSLIALAVQSSGSVTTIPKHMKTKAHEKGGVGPDISGYRQKVESLSLRHRLIPQTTLTTSPKPSSSIISAAFLDPIPARQYTR